MPIFGALAGLTAAGLYAVVDELRVSHRIRSYKLPGTILVNDYKVNDERFDGIIRRFENDWNLDGGLLYPEKLVGFFAENPNARKQWVRMQASVILHDRGLRRSCERDISQFGDEANKYAYEFASEEQRYIVDHDRLASEAIKTLNQERLNQIEKDRKSDCKDKIVKWGLFVLGILLVAGSIVLRARCQLSGIFEILVMSALPIGVLLLGISFVSLLRDGVGTVLIVIGGILASLGFAWCFVMSSNALKVMSIIGCIVFGVGVIVCIIRKDT